MSEPMVLKMKNLYSRFRKAQSNFPPIEKNKTANKGGTFSYDYADLGEILAKVRPVLNKEELSIHQGVVDNMLVTAICDDEGNALSSSVPLAQATSPQDQGKALTYARRYGLCTLLGIAAEDDTDAQGVQAPSLDDIAKLKGNVAKSAPQDDAPWAQDERGSRGDEEVPHCDKHGERKRMSKAGNYYCKSCMEERNNR